MTYRRVHYGETPPETQARGRNNYFTQRGMAIYPRHTGDILLEGITSRGDSEAARLVIPRDKLGEVIAALAAFRLEST